MIPEWHFAGRQSPGERARQEDAYLFMGLGDPGVDEYEPLLAVVSDGMGGYEAGNVASNLTVDIFSQEAARPHADLTSMFMAALRRSNEEIARMNERVGMSGCTVVSALLRDRRLRWVSVGDTSLMLFRKGTLTRLNADHSMRTATREKVLSGELSEGEASSQANMLRSAISGEAIDLIDLNVEGVPLEEGDIVLLASDGLETLPPDQMVVRLGRLAHASSGSIAQSLLNSVENARRPNQDNTTVLCIKI